MVAGERRRPAASSITSGMTPPRAPENEVETARAGRAAVRDETESPGYRSLENGTARRSGAQAPARRSLAWIAVAPSTGRSGRPTAPPDQLTVPPRRSRWTRAAAGEPGAHRDRSSAKIGPLSATTSTAASQRRHSARRRTRRVHHDDDVVRAARIRRGIPCSRRSRTSLAIRPRRRRALWPVNGGLRSTHRSSSARASPRQGSRGMPGRTTS